jgi:hypothetical protein
MLSVLAHAGKHCAAEQHATALELFQSLSMSLPWLQAMFRAEAGGRGNASGMQQQLRGSQAPT